MFKISNTSLGSNIMGGTSIGDKVGFVNDAMSYGIVNNAISVSQNSVTITNTDIKKSMASSFGNVLFDVSVTIPTITWTNTAKEIIRDFNLTSTSQVFRMGWSLVNGSDGITVELLANGTGVTLNNTQSTGLFIIDQANSIDIISRIVTIQATDLSGAVTITVI